jgi:DNA-binding MarR family transcriptional regulator
VTEDDRIDVVVRLAKVLEIVLADVGLTMNQFRLLTLVEERSPSTAELSRRLVMKPPNVSALTAGMVKRGLIKQRQQSDDGRRRVLALTKAGKGLLDTAHEQCGRTLRFLASTGPKGTDPYAALEAWLPALNEAALRVRKEADGTVDDT